MTDDILRMPMIPLRGVVSFPTRAVTFDVGRPRSVGAIEKAMENDRKVALFAQIDADTENPSESDLYRVGTIATIKQLMRMPDGTVRVFAQGDRRVIATRIFSAGDLMMADICPVPAIDPGVSQEEKRAWLRQIRPEAASLARQRGLDGEAVAMLRGTKEPMLLCEMIGADLLTETEDKQHLLESPDLKERMDLTIALLGKELEISRLEAGINRKVHEAMEKNNREFWLREQISQIRGELGENDDDEIDELKKRFAKSRIDGEAKDKVEKELRRLERMTMHNPESAVSYNYIDTMLSFPWAKYTEKGVDVAKARRILDEDHYGMQKVKERLLEFLSVRALDPDLRSPILCLVGPPGVGKTSIARSVARALGRSFAQMSLGGVHDEAELRGHRRTYLGAMPGRPVTAIDHCGALDPVFLFDEIDKLSHDLRGDPAPAMLEILDPEQNSRFRDHYMDCPIDLSRVMFITTANTTETIDRALLDRMEVIELGSYTLEEKVQIAKKHLIPKTLKAHALKASMLRISEKALRSMIDLYTREAGVRGLEKLIAKICRRAALKLSEEGTAAPIRVTDKDLKEYLGAPRYLRTPVADAPSVGVVNGLAWTSVGGEVMPVEALVLEGSGKVELTGQLGDVMKESASLAQTTVRSRANGIGLNTEWFKTHDLHVHVPEGAVPKDGPSAGVALTCAMLSAVTGIPARSDIAMTGEITLTGRVLPIGGVKEKLLAAYRMGVSNILLPRENGKDLEELDEKIRGDMNIRLIDRVEDAIGIVLTSDPTRAKAPVRKV